MNRQYQVSAKMEAVEVDGEWILLDPYQFTITKLNAMGGFLCAELKTPGTIPALMEKVQAHYAVSAETAEADIRLFIEELLQVGLVEYAG